MFHSICHGRVPSRIFRGVPPCACSPSKVDYRRIVRIYRLRNIRNLDADEKRPYIEKYLIEMDKNVLPPDYIKLRPCLDLRSIALSSDEHLAGLTNEEEEELCHFDILKGFPVLPKSGMDDSQLAACKRMLTQSLAIVQVSVASLDYRGRASCKVKRALN